MQNISNRAMHHHVFSPEVLVEMFSYFGMRVLNVTVERPYHIIVHGEKVGVSDQHRVFFENLRFLDSAASWRKRNPLSAASGATRK